MSTLDGLVRFGKTVPDVIKHRGEADDVDLNADIAFILLDKEERSGLQDFSKSERYVYAILSMIREVNNGGFDQFFFNSSGRLAYELVPALEAVGAKNALSIATRALKLFGKPQSLEDEDRWQHLEKITNDGETPLWDDLDSEFYDNAETIDAMILDYIEKNLDEFSS